MHYPDNNAVPVVIKLQLEVKIPAVFFHRSAKHYGVKVYKFIIFPNIMVGVPIRGWFNAKIKI